MSKKISKRGAAPQLKAWVRRLKSTPVPFRTLTGGDDVLVMNSPDSWFAVRVWEDRERGTERASLLLCASNRLVTCYWIRLGKRGEFRLLPDPAPKEVNRSGAIRFCRELGIPIPPQLVALPNDQPASPPDVQTRGENQPAASPALPPAGDDRPVSPPKDAPRFVMAPPSPLLADADWIRGFHWMVKELLDAGRAITRAGSTPSYRSTLIEMRWKQFLDGLAAHVMKAVEDGRNGPPIRSYVLDRNISEAYQWTSAALDEIADRSGPSVEMLAALEGIDELLSRWQAPPPAQPEDAPGQAEARPEATGCANQPSVNPDPAAPSQGGGKAAGPAETRKRPPILTEQDFADELRRLGRVTRAHLVEYMIDKSNADELDVAVHVHGNKAAETKAIRLNCNRTSKDAESLGVPFRYALRAGKIFKTP
jgi:hypothetical protein